jgi:hypothetical protein
MGFPTPTSVELWANAPMSRGNGRSVHQASKPTTVPFFQMGASQPDGPRFPIGQTMTFLTCSRIRRQTT